MSSEQASAVVYHLLCRPNTRHFSSTTHERKQPQALPMRVDQATDTHHIYCPPNMSAGITPFNTTPLPSLISEQPCQMLPIHFNPSQATSTDTSPHHISPLLKYITHFKAGVCCSETAGLL